MRDLVVEQWDRGTRVRGVWTRRWRPIMPDGSIELASGNWMLASGEVVRPIMPPGYGWDEPADADVTRHPQE